MIADVSGVSSPPTTRANEVDTSETWGTVSHFRRMTRVDLDVARYWLDTVHRPAHRATHWLLNVEGCPGCTFEAAIRVGVSA
jgi:hypothetical protein